MTTKGFLPKVILFVGLSLGSLFSSGEGLAKPPLCSEICDFESYCDTSCTDPYGQTSTCYRWGVCDFRTLIETSITIEKAYPYAFPLPYGYGLRMEYRISIRPDFLAQSVTTQYSPDGGSTWYTDEAARNPSYDWDHIHGNAVCGPAKYNLQAGHKYQLRAILNYRDSQGNLQKTYSNWAEATVEDYSELCIEEEIAQKFKPVLHRHPQDLQPEGLVDVDQVRWASRKVTNSKGEIYSDGFTKHSAFHWNRYYDWDTWGEGQKPAFFRWDMDDAEHYKEELPGERPLYYHVYKAGPYYYVQYWYFMTMNNIKDQTNEKTWHEGDFEHVALEVEKIGKRFVPRRVNFYKHEGGRQYPASECYWGAYSDGSPMDLPPKKGYDELHPHLHVWIARNSHGSYNYNEPIYEIEVAGDVYSDDVSYDPNQWTGLYEDFFRYDYLVNMGEIVRSADTDGDGWSNAHGWEWFEHWEHKRAWDDLQWLPFKGRLGTWWCKKPDGTLATFVLLFKSICTPSPRAPAWGYDWMNFSDNVDCAGFGNRDTTFKDYRWLDPYTRRVVCNP